jgi:radical SAM superfamily enzyme YgiQ (UPF0313 family)
MQPTKVYLADLRYNYSGVLANDCMPLGVAYMKAVMDRELPATEVHSRLFVYPDKLLEALKTNPPDVLMVSNYVWNEALSCQMAKLAKAIKPDILTVMGGPNMSVEPERQIAFLAAHPEIDVYVLGEGDFLATELLKLFLAADKSASRLGDGDIPSSVFRRSDGQLVHQPLWNRMKEVDEIPSPWLTGIQDEFFDGKLAPMIETNRGCPFTCTFCVQGTGYYTKVHNFGIDRMREEILYIARKIKECSPRMGTLRIADSNYGMFERDIEISTFIGQVQRDFKWPTFIDATTGKNRPERIIKSLEQVGGALVLYQAVQSLDESVLRNVKRQTIKLEAYEQLQVHMRGRGLRSNSDLILGLPGETLNTHTRALHKLLDSGIDQLHNFQAMLLKGSEMESMAARDEFKFKTGFRVLPKNFGVYGDEIVLDVEEIITATDTLPFDDYVKARKYHLNSSVFWNDSWFKDVVEFCESFGIKKSQWWQAMLDATENSTGPVKGFLDQFVHETVHELFPSREECIEYYRKPGNFERLQRGEIGDNLMYKYRALASFQLWPQICALAMDTSKQLLEQAEVRDRIADFDEFWHDFHRFEELKHAHGMNAEEVVRPVSASFQYDIQDWLADGMPMDTKKYRLPSMTTFEFRLTPEGEQEMRAAMEVWTMSLKGLSKLVTRIQQMWQVRSCVREENMAIATVA